ncbi:MAG: AhpC/TSA family protein [Planctomycetes bacterium]|nr:AhpC/TSA family protein [Planctomycetota bacterium]
MHLGSPAEGDAFLEERWPEARAVSDPDKRLYAGFGLGRASVGQLFGPRVLLAGLKARRFGVGRPVGDPRMMSGWFLVDGDEVVWSHVHAHAGEERRFEELAAAVDRVREEPASSRA